VFKSLLLGLAACLTLGAATPPAPATAVASFTPSQRAAVLDAAEKALANYTFTDKVPALRASIESHRSAYLQIGDPGEFATAVTADLYSVAHDKHVRLSYSADIMPPNNEKPSAADIAHMAQEERYRNYGYAGALRLLGNIGYLKLSGFPSMPDAQPSIDAAMALVAHTDALIVDVRHNRGGDPDSLDYLMGYFFAKPTELTSIVIAQDGKTQTLKQFSAAHVRGQRYLGKPLYVLTDDHTFSCAEQFAYDMKSLHRATLIGKTTGGGANPGGFFRLDDHFAIFVPLGRALNPYTGTNWEGTGVVPDVAVAPDGALLDAYQKALASANDTFDEALADRALALKDPAASLATSLPKP